MNDSEILDKPYIETKNEIILHSKFSIVLISFIFSPIFGGFLYCSNLYLANQKDKILGTAIAIAICDYCAFLPFIGFKLEVFSIEPLFFLNNLLISLLVVFPIWKKHFEDVDYKTRFPVKVCIIMLLLIFILFYYRIFLTQNITSELLFHTIGFTGATPAIFLFYAIIIRILYQIVK